MVAKFLDLNKPKSKWGVIFCRFPYPILPPPVLFCPLVTRLTPFIVFLLYHVNHAVWLPILTGSALALSKIKNGFVNRTTSYSPARSLKRHSFDTTLHHTAKSSMFCELESYGSSSQEGLPYGRIFPHHTEESETDQNGLWRHFIWLALLFLRRISTASETDETVTRLTQSTHVPRVHVSYAISFMSYDVSDLEKFPLSQKVMLFFFIIFIFIIIIPSTTFRFLTFLVYKILL